MLTRLTHRLFIAFVAASFPMSVQAAEIDVAALSGKNAPQGTIWLDSLDVSKIEQGWGTPQKGRSVDKHPLKIHGQAFRHGVGTHAVSEMNIELFAAAEQFDSMVGVDDETGNRGSVSFEVWVDGKKAAESGRMVSGDPPKRLQADLHGAKHLTLLVGDCDDGIDFDHADWAGALLVLTPGARRQPQTVAPADSAPPAIAHPAPVEPAIHGPRIVGCTPGRDFLFLIPATGEKPLHFSVNLGKWNSDIVPFPGERVLENLPKGLTLDPETGIISGSLVLPGMTRVEIEVSNSRGRSKRELAIVAGRHKLALTPPMGWNSWNCWATAVSDAKVRAAADAMVKSGLAAHGFQYVNIDDCWEGTRDSHGEIQSNKKFPDMKALADYVHSKGLKLGIYSSPGPKTCAGYEASWKHEAQDAATYARWGVDYLKYDWCSYGDLFPRPDRAARMKPYDLMHRGLDASNRDIVFSLCQYGEGDVWTWGADVGGNCWRTTGDIIDSWSSMSGIGFNQNGHEKYAGPGHWNDPDMLVVGKVGWGPSLHPTKLKPNEQITHISLWCLLSSPLLIGCDMSNMDDFTLALLTNDEVLDVNQDPLGKPAGRVAKDGQTEVWARPLFDGTKAVGLFNRGRQPAKVRAAWTELNLDGPQPVRDLWQHKDLGAPSDGFEAVVPAHGTVLLKVGRPRGTAGM
jgi:alpha-galactosidase